MLKKAFGYNIILVTVNSIYPFLILRLLSSKLETELIGKIFSFESLLKFMALLSSIGLSTFAVRELSSATNKVKSLSEMLTLNITFTLLTFIGLLVFSTIDPEFFINKSVWILISMLTLLNCLSLEWLFYGLSDFKFISLRNLISKGLTLVLLYFTISRNFKLESYLGIVLIQTLSQSIINLYYLNEKKLIIRKFLRVNFIHVKPLSIIALSTLLFGSIPALETYIVGRLGSYELAADYGFIIKFTRFSTSLVNGVSLVLLPYLSKKISERINIGMSIYTEIILITSIILMYILNISKEYVFEIIGANKFDDLKLIYSISLLSIPVINIINLIIFNYFAAKKFDRYIFINGAIFFLLMSLSLVVGSQIGLIETIVFLGLSQLIILIVVSFFYRKETKLNIISNKVALSNLPLIILILCFDFIDIHYFKYFAQFIIIAALTISLYLKSRKINYD